MEEYLVTACRREVLPGPSDEPHVFATAAIPLLETAMFAAILEDEGLTLVMTKADAGGIQLETHRGRVSGTLQLIACCRHRCRVSGWGLPDV
jgi:hypothetical protein